MKKHLLSLATILLSALPLLLGGCEEGPAIVGSGLDDSYYIERMKKLRLAPSLTGEAYRWYQISESGEATLLSEERDYVFVAGEEGVYRLRFEIIDGETPFVQDITVNVLHEEVEYSPWISKVYDYHPAPGQFVNEMPEYEEGDTYETMLAKVQESLEGTADVLVSLGGFGGYVTFGFDHTVMNRPGQNDFRLWGNSFYETGAGSGRRGGSAEPGIIMVSFDANCNGKADDAWYELAGSAHNDPTTIKGYGIRYYASADGVQVTWTDSEGASGTMKRNSTHPHDYFPLWEKARELSFTGTRLAPNGEDPLGDGSYFLLYPYAWGYADNHPNSEAELNSFDIANAVDLAGRPVKLPGVDFIRVYTGVNQFCGWVGETSTEISRAQDLSLE